MSRSIEIRKSRREHIFCSLFAIYKWTQSKVKKVDKEKVSSLTLLIVREYLLLAALFVCVKSDCDQELEMRIDTQKQTLSARDESIKKLLEMLQTKGEGKEEEARVHQQMQMVAQKQVQRLTQIQ